MALLWDRTHGKGRGGYLRAGANELYVRQVIGHDGLPAGLWAWYVDGILMGAEKGEAVAMAASEAAVRSMSRAHAPRKATAA